MNNELLGIIEKVLLQLDGINDDITKLKILKSAAALVETEMVINVLSTKISRSFGDNDNEKLN